MNNLEKYALLVIEKCTNQENMKGEYDEIYFNKPV